MILSTYLDAVYNSGGVPGLPGTIDDEIDPQNMLLFFLPFLGFLHYPGSPGGCLKASWGLWLGIHKLWARGEPWRPRLYRKLLEKVSLVALI